MGKIGIFGAVLAAAACGGCALTSDVNSETASRISADESLNGKVDGVSGAATLGDSQTLTACQAYTDKQLSTQLAPMQQAITGETTARSEGDQAMLAAAKQYTDDAVGKVTAPTFVHLYANGVDLGRHVRDDVSYSTETTMVNGQPVTSTVMVAHATPVIVIYSDGNCTDNPHIASPQGLAMLGPMRYVSAAGDRLRITGKPEAFTAGSLLQVGYPCSPYGSGGYAFQTAVPVAPTGDQDALVADPLSLELRPGN